MNIGKVIKHIDVTVRLEVSIWPTEETEQRFLADLDYEFNSRISDADVIDTKIIDSKVVTPESHGGSIVQ